MVPNRLVTHICRTIAPPLSLHRHHHTRVCSVSSAPQSHRVPTHLPAHHRRAHSVEAIPSATDPNTSSCSHCSCCSTHGLRQQQPLVPSPIQTQSRVKQEPADISGHLHKKFSSSSGVLDTHISRKQQQQQQQQFMPSSNKENSSIVGSFISGKTVSTTKARSDPGLRGVGNAGVPFRDRTNTQECQQGGSSNRRKRMGSLKELVPPLNAGRLRPIQQQTRSATVSSKAETHIRKYYTCTFYNLQDTNLQELNYESVIFFLKDK